jgi:predicted ABC-type ATPase
MFAHRNAAFFDPDAATRLILSANHGIGLAEANSAAWHQGKRLLERAISERLNFAFETTLGGRTITVLLSKALSSGIDVRIWYVGLATPDLHIARVLARVARGGHDIPSARIRARFDTSRLNLILLLSKLTELRLYDNSDEADPHNGIAPHPKLLLHFANRKIIASGGLALTPEWAKPILAEALKVAGRN